jgi:acyl-CoA synthetase (AMP-forming)/AMP-acid ligase II
MVYVDRPKSVGALLNVAAEVDPDALALVQADWRVTRAEILDRVTCAMAVLAARGVGAHDRVAVLAANTVEWVIAFWAVARLGAVPVLMNGWWSEDEAAHAFRVSTPVLAITDQRRRGLVPAGAPAIDLADLRGAQAAVFPRSLDVDEDAPGLIVFTSGTTGHPRAALLPHRAVIARQHATMDISGRLPSDPPAKYRRVQLLSAPLFHIGPFQQMLTSWLTGTTLILLEGHFDAGVVIQLIERERVTTWSAVPTMVNRLLSHPRLKSGNLSSLRSISVGGTNVPEELPARIATALPGVGTHVAVGYGLTEAAGTVATPRALSESADGTAGEALPTVEVRIASDEEELPGEILVRGPTVMLGYLDEVAQPIDGQGWLHTGDIGRLDDRGRLAVIDRAKDIIIRGGENIAAAHVEAQLLRHPTVAEVAVVALPHSDLGEEVGAAIVPAEGRLLDRDELSAFCAARLAHFEVPSRWWFRDEPLPLSAAAKVDKRRVRREWLEWLPTS